MIKDFMDPRNAEGMPKVFDSTVAMDLLLAAKTGVRTCAIALSEAATPDVRRVLRKQLEEALDLHDEISKYMMDKVWFHPHIPDEQFKIDLESSQTAAYIAKMELFPGYTGRLGTFATPEK